MKLVDFESGALGDFYKIVSRNVIRKEKKVSQLKLANAIGIRMQLS